SYSYSYSSYPTLAHFVSFPLYIRFTSAKKSCLFSLNYLSMSAQSLNYTIIFHSDCGFPAYSQQFQQQLKT
ncbi:hypothetical protein, partial [Sphingobacterium sp. UBA6317]